MDEKGRTRGGGATRGAVAAPPGVIGGLGALGADGVANLSTTDVGAHRVRARNSRLQRLAAVLGVVVLTLVLRDLLFATSSVPLPHVPASFVPFLPAFVLITVLGLVMVVPLLAAGRSPHVLFRPDELSMTFDDVRGSETLVEEVTKTLNLFLAHRTFAEHMGGSPRKAILFEGPPGTGKTYMAKAMAAEAGVPFLFVSSSAFQSMFYGQTNRKIRSYFKALRTCARREGGAIGFIEELDAIGAVRGSGPRHGEGVPGVVNELLVQLQSFDLPPRSVRLRSWITDAVNAWLPPGRHLSKASHAPANILVIGATNRAADLDPALLRPGRFDRSIYFGLPSRSGRRDILDYYLDRKSHEPELDDPESRETLAAMTAGYSPVMIEHVLDEALVWALRRGADRLSWDDIQHAKMTEEIGLAQPVEYTETGTPDHRHPRGRACDRGLAGGQGTQARGAHHREAPRGAGPAQSLGGRGAVHQDQDRDAGPHRDRLRWHGGRGAFLRRGLQRRGRRPAGGHHQRVPDGRPAGHGLDPHLHGGRRVPGRGHRLQGAGRRRSPGGGRVPAGLGQGVGHPHAGRAPPVVEALRDALLSARSSSARPSSTSFARYRRQRRSRRSRQQRCRTRSSRHSPRTVRPGSARISPSAPRVHPPVG